MGKLGLEMGMESANTAFILYLRRRKQAPFSKMVKTCGGWVAQRQRKEADIFNEFAIAVLRNALPTWGYAITVLFCRICWLRQFINGASHSFSGKTRR